jgi:hypothetical protein
MRDVSADEFVPKGATLAIKQPYFHVDMVHPPQDTSDSAVNLKSMFFVLRLDHPTDLVVLPPCDTLVPLQFRDATSVATAAVEHLTNDHEQLHRRHPPLRQAYRLANIDG